MNEKTQKSPKALARKRKWAQVHPKEVREDRHNWYEKNKDKVSQDRRSRTKANPARRWNRLISTEEFQAVVTEQAGRCAICGDGVKLLVDHDHATGQLRGLLCNGCNCALGFMRDNPAILRKAAEYLERRKA